MNVVSVGKVESDGWSSRVPSECHVLPARASGVSSQPAINVSSVCVKETRMSGAIAKVQRFLVSEDGPTAVEYAVMLALIVVACITVISSLSKSVSNTFSSVSSSLGTSS